MSGRQIAARLAEEADLGALLELRRAWNEENAGGRIGDPGFEDRFRRWVESEGGTRTFFLVLVDGEPVGMANVKRYERMPAAGRDRVGCWGYVGNVFVLVDHRDTGVGQVLMDTVIRWAGAQSLAHLRLAPSPRSRSFYERLGFVPGAVVELDPPG